MVKAELSQQGHAKNLVSTPLRVEGYYAAYKPFASAILQLQQELAPLTDPRLHPAHLGYPDSRHGVATFKHGFRLPGTTGLVVTLLKDTNPTSRAAKVNETTTDLSRLRNLDGFVHILASSPEAGAIISRELSGVPSEEANDALLEQLSTQVLARAVDNISAASEGGIFLDRHPGNILLGPNISFLDPHEGIHTDTLEVNILTLALALAYAGETNNTTSEATRLTVLNRLREIVKGRFPDSRFLDQELGFIIRRFE